MVFKSIKGMFQLKQNYRDAFQLEAFNEKYIEECMDKYLFIVGDISSGILRLKGFDNDPKSVNFQGNIANYLEVSCAFGCPFYVLKHIRTEEEYAKLEKNSVPVDETGGMQIVTIKKENFDKESLILKSTPKVKPNIVIDSQKLNAIPVGILAPDLVEYVQQDKSSSQNASSNNNGKQAQAPVKEEVQTTSYVSSSPDFDPSRSTSSRFNRNQNRNRNKNKPTPNLSLSQNSSNDLSNVSEQNKTVNKPSQQNNKSNKPNKDDNRPNKDNQSNVIKPNKTNQHNNKKQKNLVEKKNNTNNNMANNNNAIDNGKSNNNQKPNKGNK